MAPDEGSFGDWLNRRAHARGAAPMAAGIDEHGRMTIDLACALLTLGLGVACGIGAVLFDRYSPARDILQMGLGLLSLFVALLGLTLAGFAALHGVALRIKLALPLTAIGAVLGLALSLTEIAKRSEDRERERRGEIVRDLENARTKGWR